MLMVTGQGNKYRKVSDSTSARPFLEKVFSAPLCNIGLNLVRAQAISCCCSFVLAQFFLKTATAWPSIRSSTRPGVELLVLIWKLLLAVELFTSN